MGAKDHCVDALNESDWSRLTELPPELLMSFRGKRRLTEAIDLMLFGATAAHGSARNGGRGLPAGASQPTLQCWLEGPHCR